MRRPSTPSCSHHVGHANVLAYLKRLKPTFPTVDKLVVSGISAGGFGALFNFRDFRSRWPTGALYLLDDSGPLLENASFSANFETSWFANWHLAEVTDPVCGAACQSDLSLMQSALAAAYPGDRMALLSSEQDTTVRNSYLLSGPQFQTALLAMATDRLDPTTRFRYFFTGGSNHTMLGAPASVSQNSVALLTWLGQLVDDDPGWTTVKP